MYPSFQTRFYCFPSLCIQLPKRNSDGQFNIHDVPNFTAKALDDTRAEVWELISVGVITTDALLEQEFKRLWLENLRDEFGLHDNSGNLTIQSTPCNNPDTNVSRPHYNVCGLCIPQIGDCP